MRSLLPILPLQPFHFTQNLIMPRPDLNRVQSFYHKYISLVEEDELFNAFSRYTAETKSFLERIPADKTDFRYAEGKWSVKEVLQHMIDAERVFSLRALWLARKDIAPQPGFDENRWAENANTSTRSWEDLLEEFIVVRKSTMQLFNSFDQEALEASGIINNAPAYVLGIGFLLIGHTLHHQKIIGERYLS